MPIPKAIYQTYKHHKLPWLTRWHIHRLRRLNKDYSYHFYDDQAVRAFMQEAYGTEMCAVYDRISIGAAKADFFRYAILYKKGGVYLDIDSLIPHALDSWLLPGDRAVISRESHGVFYIQYALFFEAGHPFLKQVLDDVVENIVQNRYPNDVHAMTGPTAFTVAIEKVLKSQPNVPHRVLGHDYLGHVKFSYPMAKTMLYGFKRKGHWKRQEVAQTVLKQIGR